MNHVCTGNRQVKGNVFVVFRHIGSIGEIAAHDDMYIAASDDDGRVILREKATGTSLSSSLHDGVVNDCVFSRDGRYLVTSSNDCTAPLWKRVFDEAGLVQHGAVTTPSSVDSTWLELGYLLTGPRADI